jgi:glucose-1-phosphate thymidylyltransferase
VRGIILAGGRGTRLYPLTLGVSKQLLPLYDKPMIYYPLSVLLLAGIREVLIISTREDSPSFQRVLGDGSQWGLAFAYAEQDQPRGLAEALLIGRDFIGGEPVCLILGDNVFFGQGLSEKVQAASTLRQGALIFAYPVRDPRQYGVIEFDPQGHALSIEEKPAEPRSRYAVPGLYFYDGKAAELAGLLRPSERGELEITDLHRLYLDRGELRVNALGRGIAWLDAGTHDALLQAANFVQAVEDRQGLMIACPEEIVFHRGYIDRDQLLRLAQAMPVTRYRAYLLSLLDETPGGWSPG